MPDGYYSVSSTNNAPSNFSGNGMMSVYTVNGVTYLVLTDSSNNNTWKGSANTSNPSMSWIGWNQVGNESDIASNTNLINNLQNQTNNLANTAVIYHDDQPISGNGDLLATMVQKQRGIYMLINFQGTNGPSGVNMSYGVIEKNSLPTTGDFSIKVIPTNDNGAYFNVYNGWNHSWNGWKKEGYGSGTIQNNDDLNNYTTTGVYQSFNAQNIQNSPYNYSLWFQLSVQTGGGFTTQVLTSSWGETWIRTLSNYPAFWNQWVRINAH